MNYFANHIHLQPAVPSVTCHPFLVRNTRAFGVVAKYQERKEADYGVVGMLSNGVLLVLGLIVIGSVIYNEVEQFIAAFR